MAPARLQPRQFVAGRKPADTGAWRGNGWRLTAGAGSGPASGSGRRASSACSSTSSRDTGESLGRRSGTCRTHRATVPATTGWRSPRSTRPGSFSSTTTRGCVRHELRRPLGRLHGGFFASAPLELFDVIFQHTEGYEGLPDLAAVKAFILGAQQTAAAYARNYGGTVKEIRKALRVNEAFQQVLDDPEAAEALQHPALKPLLDEAADGVDVRSHLRTARAGRADRGHHRRLRLSESRAAGRWCSSEHAPVRPAIGAFSDGLVYRFRLRPLTRLRPATRRRSPRPTTSSWSTASSHRRQPNWPATSRRASARLRRRDGRFRVNDRRAARGAACGCSPARAGIRSSWTLRPR